MAYGDTPYDQQFKDSWDSFCDRLKQAAHFVFDDPAPSTPLDRAAGFQYLARMVPHSLDRTLEYDTPLFPQLWRYMSPVSKWGGDNPDSLYTVAAIDGEHTYRIVGNRGSAHYVVVSAQRRWDDVPAGESAEVARLVGQDLKTDWDGSFELVLSPNEHPGNWLKTTPDTYRVLIRQFHYDWVNEEQMRIRIERVGSEGETPPPLTPERVTGAFNEAVGWLLFNVEYWRGWQERHGRGSDPRDAKQGDTYMPSNEFVPFGGGPSRFGGSARFTGGIPGGQGMACTWKVEPDEVLLIEVTPPNCHFWNYELSNYWMSSLDYRYHFSGINGYQAVPEEDGLVRVALSHDDPGLMNWLSTGGHVYGNIVLRWIRADGYPIPATRIVKRADLPSAVPANARQATPEERREQLRVRRTGIDKRFKV